LEETLLDEATAWLAAEGKKLFFDPVSANKAVKAKKCIGRFFAVKPNRIEAEVLSGIHIENEEDLGRCAKWFMAQGVKQVFITLNKDGVYYCDGKKEGIIRPGKVNLVSATGAGDSFSAMILLGMAEELDIEQTAKMGMAASSIAMESPAAVNKNINREEILRRIK
jgi:pseudouridine kinase